jgi:hypothetical protein
MNIIPTKAQWKKWSLPSKAGYVGAWIGAIALIIAIAFPVIQAKYAPKRDRPLLSVMSIDCYLNNESMETKYIIKNVGSKPAYILIKGEAFIDGHPMDVIDRESETHFQTVMPDQTIKYSGLFIKGNKFKLIMGGKIVPEIVQTIRISYGDAEKSIGEYYTYQRNKLDVAKLAKFKDQSKISDGLWLVKESNFK